MVFEFQTISGGLGIIDPVLISVAVDKKIILWDLNTLFANSFGSGDMLHGHGSIGGASSGIQTNSAAVHSLLYAASASSSSSTMHSHGSGSVGVHVGHGHDIFPGSNYTAIPTFGAIEHAFELDKQEKSLGAWPRLSKMVDNYGGSAILALATRLFYQVRAFNTAPLLINSIFVY